MTITTQYKKFITDGRIHLPESINILWIHLILVLLYLSDLSKVLSVSVEFWVNEKSDFLMVAAIIYSTLLMLMMSFLLIKSWRLNFNSVCCFLLATVANSVIVNILKLL